MAYNPNVPEPDHLVQDDIAAMRENFQHLDPLAQIVSELQTVSGLAPITDDLQTISGLAPVANELQTVSELASVVEELQTVSGLAPYVQALLDSRIVEMGSNSNGYNVRWEHGLQVCWRSRLTLTRESSAQAYDTWTFPAEFLDTDYSVLITQAWSSGDTRAEKPTMAFTQNRSTINCRPVLTSKDSDLAAGEYWGVHLVAIGSWK